MNHRTVLSLVLSCLLAAIGCGDDSSAGGGAGGGSAGSGGTGGTGFMPPVFGEWVKFEPEGGMCSDGSPYKYFVQFSETSDNLILFFEGGGACWDYESCTDGGLRGAANPNGLPDDHVDNLVDFNDMAIGAKFVYPLLNDSPDVSPMADWNKVFVPYCTGDVYSGQTTTTYPDPDGIEEDLVFRHVGHTNILAMIAELNTMFDEVPRLFVGGCSAGGAGAIINYNALRSGLNNVGQGYLLDDSGPIYPNSEATSRSLPLHNQVRTSWNVDPLIMTAPNPMDIFDDFGNLSTALAAEYPNDRLAVTFFRLDYNYSLYSYERFYDNSGIGNPIVPIEFGTTPFLDEFNWIDRNAFYSLWWDDIALLRAQYDAVDNLGYYLPFYRDTNDSHCVTIPGVTDVSLAEQFDALTYIQTDGAEGAFAPLAYAGSDIDINDEMSINLRGYVEHLLDDSTPLASYFEMEIEGHFQECVPDNYDESNCQAAVCERLSASRQMEQGCPEP